MNRNLNICKGCLHYKEVLHDFIKIRGDNSIPSKNRSWRIHCTKAGWKDIDFAQNGMPEIKWKDVEIPEHCIRKVEYIVLNEKRS